MRLAITFPHSLAAPGGGTNDCLDLARHLSRAGAEVVLLPVASLGPTRFPRPRPPAEYSGREEAADLAEEGIEVIPVDRHPAHYLLDGLPIKRAVQERLDRRPVDALIGWWNETFFLPRLLRARGVVFAMIATASYAPSFRPDGGPPRLDRRLRNRLFFAGPLRRADLVFARSAFVRREVIELCGVDRARVQVVYPGIDPRLADVPRSFSSPVARLLFFGSFAREKGVFDALEALGRVAAAGRRDWTLRIAGWGDEERVRAAAREEGILERVEFLGPLDASGVARALEWAQLAVLPSHAESFGLANAEAQAAGVPVLAYDVAAVPEVVEQDVTGWLVPLARVDRLADAITAALDDPEGRSIPSIGLRCALQGRSTSARMDKLVGAIYMRG